MNQVIFISGTPCVGKTTLASELSKRLGANLVRINELAIGKDLILGIDNKKGYKIIDVPKLDVALGEIIDNLDSDKLLIVEGHLSHLCTGADKVIILRVHPSVLEKDWLTDNILILKSVKIWRQKHLMYVVLKHMNHMAVMSVK